MPIWLELLSLLLAAYAVGLALGWVIWARGAVEPTERDERETAE